MASLEDAIQIHKRIRKFLQRQRTMKGGTNLTPEQIAQGLLTSNLGEIAKVQTLLAQEGIELHLATAEIVIEEQSERILGPKPHPLQTKRG